METTIYYYSSTGNSLAFSREIARLIGGARIEPIARYRTDPARPRTARVGFVFPIHGWGPPSTVEEFISKVDLEGADYVFAVSTCGGTAANTLPMLRKTLRARGFDLNAGFIVRAPGYLDGGGTPNGLIELVRKLSGRPFGTTAERLFEIADVIQAARTMKPERNALAGALLGSFFHTKAGASFRTMDANYTVAPTCSSCGTCVRVCPRGNISRESGITTWHHDCEFCGACATWCTQHAIGFRGQVGPARRHHEQAALKDFVLR
jgi:Pyruvate/2-oxoacid:ferredoxin oxidoreductase delta subunit/flavodoxin